MGYIRHNAIVVTSWDGDAINAALSKARELGLAVAGPGPEVVNGYQSFLICPDGSKEGWDESAEGDERREKFRAYMLSTRYSDGSGPLEWVEVQYGSDDDKAEVIATPWESPLPSEGEMRKEMEE